MSFAHAIDTKRLAAFVRRPWSVTTAFYVAAAIGSLSPVIKMFFYRWLSWRAVPFVFFALLAVVAAFLYWQVERSQFRTDRRARLATLAAGLLWAVGAAGSGWCCSAHVCMAGHMDHPPYALWHYAADAGWSLAVALAAVWMWSVRASLCLAFAVLSAFLISYRFIFGSLGGMYEAIPL